MYTISAVGPATTFVVSFESTFMATGNFVLVLLIAIVQLASAFSEKAIPELVFQFGSPCNVSFAGAEPTADRMGWPAYRAISNPILKMAVSWPAKKALKLLDFLRSLVTSIVIPLGVDAAGAIFSPMFSLLGQVYFPQKPLAGQVIIALAIGGRADLNIKTTLQARPETPEIESS
jgi:hypothetical protein